MEAWWFSYLYDIWFLYCFATIPLLFFSVSPYYLSVWSCFLTEVSPFPVMAGLAPEGTQFDGRQYDAKMTEL